MAVNDERKNSEAQQRLVDCLRRTCLKYGANQQQINAAKSSGELLELLAQLSPEQPHVKAEREAWESGPTPVKVGDDHESIMRAWAEVHESLWEQQKIVWKAREDVQRLLRDVLKRLSDGEKP